MAPLRNGQSRIRPRRPPVKKVNVFEDFDNDDFAQPFEDEPPRKRRRTSRRSSTRPKWIPGGRGGGGRHIDIDKPVTIVGDHRSPDDYAGPRRRGGRDSNKTMSTTPRYSARSRTRGGARPRYSTAAAASAAVAHGDGYKPREERGWEEFHPDLELGSNFAVIESEEVDGICKKSSEVNELDGQHSENEFEEFGTPSRRSLLRKKPGRPPRGRDSMLNSLITPETPKVVPVPGPNPRERLTLPKPSYRELDPFLSYEQKEIAHLNFVDKTMASVGYQESEMFLRPERTFVRQMEGSAEEDLDLSPALLAEGENSAIGSNGVGRVEYDMDEQDVKWLESFNKSRIKDGVGIIKPAVFEITMTKIEKEWHALEKRIPKPNPKAPQTQRPRSSSAAAVNGEPGTGEEPDSKCAICDDGDCENANAIVFCDGCDLAVHQECYGVPYIPEGQWLCRKCQLVGSARPSCIFCPTEGGAFKQTNNSKWAHLFCATWIPEVSIGNPSLMEPITDVEKVPPSRWKLGCYICNQMMGASIQCSDGRCYEPFHLTCARQAGLYLKMKTGGGQNSLMDSSQLRAYCHKHTPSDWRQEHETDKSFEAAKNYFKEHFRGQVWADSRTSALALNDTQDNQNMEGRLLKMTLTNKKGQKQKTIWKLPSGAPVIPEVVLKSIEDSLVRFLVQKKKEYVSEVCKYWTLKREARRGAALLKRLQLQMDTFSSFEVTRRDYKAQGAAGRARLDRRIGFAEKLVKDLDRVRLVCSLIKQREAEKLKNVAIMKEIVDTVYYPIPPLLQPILEKAFRHDPRRIYTEGLCTIQAKMSQRVYTSISPFSSDLAQVLSVGLDIEAFSVADLQTQLSGPTTDLNVEQRERRTLARRIVKAVQPALEDVIIKEAELTGRPYAQEIREMDEMLLSRRHSVADTVEPSARVVEAIKMTNGIKHQKPGNLDHIANARRLAHSVKTLDSSLSTEHANGVGGDVLIDDLIQDQGSSAFGAQLDEQLFATSSQENAVHSPPASTNGIKHELSTIHPRAGKQGEAHAPPTPPISLEGNQQASLIQGGIPWYVEQFDPEGTTVYEERWTGPEVLRDLSEELSEMDEDELEGLGGAELEDVIEGEKENDAIIVPLSPLRKTVKKGARQKRGHDWGQRSFRNRRWN